MTLLQDRVRKESNSVQNLIEEIKTQQMHMKEENDAIMAAFRSFKEKLDNNTKMLLDQKSQLLGKLVQKESESLQSFERVNLRLKGVEEDFSGVNRSLADVNNDLSKLRATVLKEIRYALPNFLCLAL